MRIDLHCHSSVSDGTRSPAEMMRRAGEARLDVVALTDHDTQAGQAEARGALPEGLTLAPGMELSCRLQGRSLHLLVYHADPADPALSAECDAIVAGRLTRGREMVDRLRDLGVDITWEQVQAIAAGGVVGRPHIADALVAAGAIADRADAFTPMWIGPGGRAHARKYALDPVRAIELATAAGGVTVLAHPGDAGRGWQIPDEEIARLREAGLTGLEIDHPSHDEAQRLRLRALAGRLGLVVTGGSDDHGTRTGDRIGCELTAPDAYERLMSLVPGRTRPAGGAPGQP